MDVVQKKENVDKIKFNMKLQIHPHWFINVPIIYEGKIVAYTQSTSEQLIIKAWHCVYPSSYKDHTQVSISLKPKKSFITKYTNISF